MQAPRWTTAIEIVEPIIKSVSALQEYGVQVKTALHDWILAGGEQRRRIADLLHGVPIGHPLHVILTDIPIGAWTLGALFDLLSLINPFSKHYKQTADSLTALGVVSAIPTAVAGITDYSAIKEDAADFGLLHGILNTTGLILYILSWRARRRQQRLLGIGFGMLGMSVMTASAWIGGEMVYRLRVGANHSPKPEAPEEWQAVYPARELEEGEVQKVELDGQPILLYRSSGNVSAISAVCAHAGGPLDEGKFYDGCVQCPWHDSVYDLSTGQIVHGPTVFPQPTYDVRITNGQIRLRAPQQDAPQS
jgi:nitrite reductase/ring-hydroxylating ferredoxin subunit/uncharacterized membrane protein